MRDVYIGPESREGRHCIPHVFIGGVENKSCSVCGSLKALDAYAKDRSRADGLDHRCRSCYKSRYRRQ